MADEQREQPAYYVLKTWAFDDWGLYGRGDELLARALLERALTVATAESCTAGLLVARLVDRAGSSAYVLGGTVAYSNDAKVAQLGVPAELIEAHGAVSPEVARAMADGARAR